MKNGSFLPRFPQKTGGSGGRSMIDLRPKLNSTDVERTTGDLSSTKEIATAAAVCGSISKPIIIESGTSFY